MSDVVRALDSPISREWLVAMGFRPVESDMGPDYDEHYELGQVNIWEFNDTGVWLLNDADWMQLETRRHVLLLLDLASTRKSQTCKRWWQFWK